MDNEIVNRVAKSPLITLNLEDFYPKGQRILLDIKPWLHQELVLKELEFRAVLKQHDWTQYQDCYVALNCSADAIVPSWAYLLITTYLAPYCKTIVKGTLDMLETIIYQEVISNLDLELYRDKPVIIKGCSNKPIPETAFVLLTQSLQPVVKSLMFGEACSTVPLYKRKK